MSIENIFKAVEEKFGFLPNIIEELGKSPAALQVYLKGQDIMGEAATLTHQEQQIVCLAVSTENKCKYCQAAHRAAGIAMGTSSEDVTAIQSGGTPRNSRLSGLVMVTRRIMEKKGWLNERDLNELEGSGIDRQQVYEIVALIGLKTITNYVNHLSHIKIDPQFSG